MEEMKIEPEFKIGDFITRDEVLTPEGSAKYRRMAKFCDEHHLVMKEDEFYESGGEPLPEGAWEEPIPIYRISEPDPVPTPTEQPPTAPTQEDRIAQLEKENEELTLIVADLIGGRK